MYLNILKNHIFTALAKILSQYYFNIHSILPQLAILKNKVQFQRFQKTPENQGFQRVDKPVDTLADEEKGR